MSLLFVLIGTLAFAILAPILGCLLAGLDRKISARMQGRVGPPLLQPYYDVRKLIEKDNVSVNSTEGTYVTCALVFTLIAGGIFFSGGNLLMSVFVITLSALFFIVAAYSTRSPYAEIGAGREMLQVMAYEPMILFMAVAFFMSTSLIGPIGTFSSAGALLLDAPVITNIWLVFLGFLFVLTIKLRKSPFDLSYSHHAHQEIVKGITTEMSGKTLAKVEVMHWCENILFLGWTGLFFVWSNPLSILLAVVVALLVYFLEIWIDNNFARVKWQFMLKSAWIVAFVAGGVNIAVLAYL
ncbi:NADH-quinone oxidoreductase subunit H [Paraeggerthella hongkongensis]|uniref:Ech hydrogenase subunit EchB n=1 Tax=Paraeggerthella hongkongensis TaxID=230658 RepID=A0A369LLN1_9ACTN|nr:MULTISPECIES: NADH-quinone oxidoreductase subunit H [Paraeggerthella]MDY3981835.1 NADH-quinone oxidoreductase subunit H [Paraeggerthella sp.]MBU5404398.1 NADH-quinone oxidoreductase subunit H [Paraeggerthella hongkongensis]MCD2432094.1 NADH-quinone oxidoreductase subunit H [Paraeggerthella hominis]RDB59589.1 Ech hydrogenase subunit EchB [Paraeggerthella hongkongensis]RNL48309.1 Ech hydrogenase subunit EchB [Paraeggerthella hongkongensis]